MFEREWELAKALAKLADFLRPLVPTLAAFAAGKSSSSCSDLPDSYSSEKSW